jgi:nicotinate-nucleotide pyrophosphorylase
MANRKAKLSKYEVIIKRQIEHVATVEVEARTAEEAQQVAENAVDNVGANYWREGDVISQSAKVKVIRGE